MLRYKKVSFFQLRLKKENFNKKIIIGRKIKKICKKFNVKFLVNDDVHLAKILNADGCHLGQKDMNILDARKLKGIELVNYLKKEEMQKICPKYFISIISNVFK